MIDLGGALKDLAGHAAAPSAADPDGLWRRGRTRQRRRQLAVGALGLVLAAVMAGLGTYAVVPRSAVSPSDRAHEPALPMNVWTAPDWIPPTSEVGPPGTVAAMGPWDDKPDDGRFVISARTGEYSRLVLPDYFDFDGEEQMQLSPDGNHIGYFFRDPAVKTQRRDDLHVHGIYLTTVSGFAVYDTRTGEVRRFKVPLPGTGTGFVAYGTQSMVWLGNSNIAFYGAIEGGSTKHADRNYVWNLNQAKPSKLRFIPPGLGNIGPPNSDGELLGMADDAVGRRFGYLNTSALVEPRTVITLPRDDDDLGFTRVVKEGSTVLGSLVGGGSGDGVYKGRVGPRGVVAKMTQVQELEGFDVMGSMDRTHVLVLGPVESDEKASLNREDLSTGVLTRLGSARGAGNRYNEYVNSGSTPFLQIATDLLDRPMVDGVHPPRTDPRIRLAAIVAGGVAAAVALAGAIFFLRRRRD